MICLTQQIIIKNDLNISFSWYIWTSVNISGNPGYIQKYANKMTLYVISSYRHMSCCQPSCCTPTDTRSGNQEPRWSRWHSYTGARWRHWKLRCTRSDRHRTRRHPPCQLGSCRRCTPWHHRREVPQHRYNLHLEDGEGMRLVLTIALNHSACTKVSRYGIVRLYIF